MSKRLWSFKDAREKHTSQRRCHTTPPPGGTPTRTRRSGERTPLILVAPSEERYRAQSDKVRSDCRLLDMESPASQTGPIQEASSRQTPAERLA